MNLKVKGDSIEEVYKGLVLEVKSISESVYMDFIRRGCIIDDNIEFRIKTVIYYNIELEELEEGIKGIEDSIKDLYNKDEGELFPIRITVEEVGIGGETRDGRPIINVLYRFR